MGEDLPARSKAQDLPVCPWDCVQRPQEGTGTGDRERIVIYLELINWLGKF